jgi:formamidopyrimidine-DNA glycosylase
MPELPEVETARLLAQRVATGRRIVRVRCTPDPIVFEAVSPARFEKALVGRRVTGVGRHGKHLWFELDRRPWPCLHFGMSGGLHAPGARRVKLASSHARDAGDTWPPRFTKLLLRFDDGGELAVSDARRLGRIRLRRDPTAEPPISRLGFDALLSVPPPRQFLDRLKERGAPVKALLLDQSFAAGVGNWIADEVLYQAQIAPRRPAGSLSAAEGRRLRAALVRVIATAVAARADSDRYPRSWLFHRRWGRQRNATTLRGEKIRHEAIAGRTAAWVPSVQR